MEAQRCKRFDEPNSRKLCLRSRLRGVGNDELRRFEVLGYKILSLGLPAIGTNAMNTPYLLGPLVHTYRRI